MKRGKKKSAKKTAKAKRKKPSPRKRAAKKTGRRKARPSSRQRGLMFVLSSPSGAGKTTLTRMLLEDEKKNVELSVSVTTRAKRASEIEGRHYFFVDRPRYDEMVKKGDLLEWAEVHGNGYGTPKKPVEASLRAGKDVLFDIDWQGTLQLYAAARADVVSVFVLPPSAQELRTRLARRAEDNQEVIDRRLRNAIEELEHWREYDYILINDDLDRAYRALKSILVSERKRRASGRAPGKDAAVAEQYRRDRQPGLEAFVRSLQDKL
jgi:guanylate kinase